MAKILKIGDIFEIRTPKGLAYMQYTLKDAAMGHLIRILPGIFKDRPDSFKNIALSKELYFIFFPLAAAVNRKIVSFVANEEIPSWARKKPIMKREGGITREGKVLNWFINEGERQIIVDSLTEEQKKYSPEAIWNDTMLIERICKGWLPKDEA